MIEYYKRMQEQDKIQLVDSLKEKPPGDSPLKVKEVWQKKEQKREKKDRTIEDEERRKERDAAKSRGTTPKAQDRYEDERKRDAENRYLLRMEKEGKRVGGREHKPCAKDSASSPDSSDEDKFERPGRSDIREKNPAQLYGILTRVHAKKMSRGQICNWKSWAEGTLNHIEACGADGPKAKFQANLFIFNLLSDDL